MRGNLAAVRGTVLGVEVGAVTSPGWVAGPYLSLGSGNEERQKLVRNSDPPTGLASSAAGQPRADSDMTGDMQCAALDRHYPAPA